jgi:(p)ppGpp synthase/HD superfamily hydrolase
MNRDKLIEFVKQQHCDQVRKYTGEPYFNHLLAVATAAEKTGVNYGWEIGLCHDLLEDTECAIGDLQSALINFGYSYGCTQIVKGVIDLTDVFTTEAFPYLNRTIRKQCEALRLHTISRTGQIIKCCDLIDNTKSIVQHDPVFAVKYIGEKRDILKGFTKIDGPIKAEVWNCLLDAEEKLKSTT